MGIVNWGVLSTAGIAQQQLIPAFTRATNAKVAAIASNSSPRKAQAIADQFQIEKVYGSYEALLDDEGIDAVYIPLPNHLHKKWVLEAAKKGKHILCEKPAALHTADVLEMKKVCEENGVLFMEAFMYYFHPQHDRVKQIIDTGEIGEVKAVRAAFSFYLSEKEGNIRMDKQKGGGSMYDIGCYAIHSIRNILRQEPESVHIHAIKDTASEVDTDVHGFMTFPNGVLATVDASFNRANQQEYEVHGTKGMIKVPRAYRPDEHDGEGIVIVETSACTRKEYIKADQYCNEVEHISEAILMNKDTLQHDFNNTIYNMKVIDACYQSIENQDMVYVEK